eukprot:CAMPEP_0205903710 /NCGR_PEP_ID=MMETSP1325-20131115/272_1 /ASSEMBLY_ACC=CAM_ASM_000708 /TAXON_ID=236786 /ORGANISM="Florenciella sp., Strain RCC1007" /LENGTH=125 /DNA_ID=CAMNT_0053269389 /DNA_START=12 /DNA_END=386 /DNA_ORIENTATION=-
MRHFMRPAPNHHHRGGVQARGIKRYGVPASTGHARGSRVAEMMYASTGWSNPLASSTVVAQPGGRIARRAGVPRPARDVLVGRGAQREQVYAALWFTELEDPRALWYLMLGALRGVPTGQARAER